MRLGIALLNLGQHDAAHSALERARELDPVNPDIHLNLGQAADARERFRACTSGTSRLLLRLFPDHVDAMFNLGRDLPEENELDAARGWFEPRDGAAPRHADALVNLGVVAEQQQHLDEAIAYLRRAMEIDPARAMARNNLAHALTVAGPVRRSAHANISRPCALPRIWRKRAKDSPRSASDWDDTRKALVHLRELFAPDPQRPDIVGRDGGRLVRNR